MKRLGFSLFCFSFFVTVAHGVEVLKSCPVHEAMVTQEFGNLTIPSIQKRPPQEMNEEIPRQDNARLMWIPGYWSWSHERGDYIWVSGVWRNPPPRHQWISGYWKRFPEGWVWIKGFWSATKENDLAYIQRTPPDEFDEAVSLPPNPADSYFWIPGFWSYDFPSDTFVWHSGRWELLQDRLIYTPNRYLWREKGFIFVPGFWDWELENRGTAYACVYIPENERSLNYLPNNVMHDVYIMESLFAYWPNYLSLFRYHFYFHNNLWVAWGDYPNWWRWSTWWCFTWHDTWWLWWWWTHPTYPAPFWMSVNYASKIVPPTNQVEQMMRKIVPPVNVTHNGVVGSSVLIDALQNLTGRDSPILPSDPKQVMQIQDMAFPNQGLVPSPSPTGTYKNAEAPRKPFFGPHVSSLKNAPKKAFAPQLPQGFLSGQNPKPPKETPRQVFQNANFNDEDRTGPRRHLITPEVPRPAPKPQVPQTQRLQKPPAIKPQTPRPPVTQAPQSTLQSGLEKGNSDQEIVMQSTTEAAPEDKDEIISQGNYSAPPDIGDYYGPPADFPPPPEVEPWQYRPTPGRLSPFPSQFNRQPEYGINDGIPQHTLAPPTYSHLETPMMLRHQDTIGTHHLPQSNPPGPKVHQFPDDFSNQPLNP